MLETRVAQYLEEAHKVMIRGLTPEDVLKKLSGLLRVMPDFYSKTYIGYTTPFPNEEDNNGVYIYVGNGDDALEVANEHDHVWYVVKDAEKGKALFQKPYQLQISFSKGMIVGVGRSL